MDRKKFRRQQVLETLGKNLDYDNVFFGVILLVLGIWITFLGYLTIQFIKSFFV